MEINEEIKRLREEKFPTYYAFAKHIGEDPSTIRDIENGKQGGKRGLSKNMIDKIAAGLGLENIYLSEKKNK